MVIANVKGNGFTVEWLKVAVIGVNVDEYKFASLFLVEHMARRKGESTHIGEKPYKEMIFMEKATMVPTH